MHKEPYKSLTFAAKMRSDRSAFFSDDKYGSLDIVKIACNKESDFKSKYHDFYEKAFSVPEFLSTKLMYLLTAHDLGVASPKAYIGVREKEGGAVPEISLLTSYISGNSADKVHHSDIPRFNRLAGLMVANAEPDNNESNYLTNIVDTKGKHIAARIDIDDSENSPDISVWGRGMASFHNFSLENNLRHKSASRCVPILKRLSLDDYLYKIDESIHGSKSLESEAFLSCFDRTAERRKRHGTVLGAKHDEYIDSEGVSHSVSK